MISLFEKERSAELEDMRSGLLNENDSKTTLILNTWNSLVKDRYLFCHGTLKVKPNDGEEYDIKYLSSGEKNIFYFLTSIILQPEKNTTLLMNQKTI